MKILLVSHYYHPEPLRITDLAEILANSGHEVEVVTSQPNYPEGRHYPGYGWFRRRRERIGPVLVHRLPTIPRGRGRALGLASNYLSFTVLGTFLVPMLCRKPYDVIFVFAPSPLTSAIPAIVMKWLRRRPLALWLQDLWPESLEAVGMVRSSFLMRCATWLSTAIYRSCDVILIQSKAFAPRLQALGIPAERLSYLPNSAESFYGLTSPGSLPESKLPDGFRIMYAGNLGAAQGLEHLLEAAEKLRAHPRIRWIVVGGGRLRSWFEDEVKRRNLSTITLLPRQAPDQMPPLIAQADALFISLRPSPIFELTIPSKLQSALASGKPIIAALAGEPGRIVREARAGVVCQPGDAGSLVDAARLLCDLPDAERQAMGVNGLHYYETNFSREVVLAHLQRQLQRLTAGEQRD